MPSGADILLIANPAAKNGTCGAVVEATAAKLRSALPEIGIDVALTEAPRHAVSIAQSAEGRRAIIALGGDGLAHEIASGLMSRDGVRDAKPALGVLPFGSGNDFARAIGMPLDLDAAIGVLLECLSEGPRKNDVGRVNGEYFIETLSFGVDAAIALDTVERRKKSGKSGTALYLESGMDQLLHHLDEHAYHADFADRSPAGGTNRSDDGTTDDDASTAKGTAVSGRSITFAVQIGPYYGGGFKICPEASLDDGLFDVCISHPPLSVARAVWIFLRAKSGSHTHFAQVEMLRCTGLHVSFEKAPPTQADGERLEATDFDIDVVPRALDVLRPDAP